MAGEYSPLPVRLDHSLPMPPALRLHDLRFAYAGSLALEVPSLRLEAGEELLLEGASGSGKSTLLHLIAGILEPTRGTIEIAGETLSSTHGAARDRLRGRRVGMIFQTFNLLSGFSAAENVSIAMLLAGRPASEHRPRAESLLASLGVEAIDRPVERLSVGQQQRVAVARALAAKPALVLADEPTASLDPDHAERAVSLIRNACREEGAALLLTSHDPAMRELFADRVDIRRFVREETAT
jgi:putative ABC transport system ATP-binding protein